MTAWGRDRRVRIGALCGGVALGAAVVIPIAVWIVQGLDAAANVAQVVSIPLAVASVLLSATLPGKNPSQPPEPDSDGPDEDAEAPRRLRDVLPLLWQRVQGRRRRIAALLVLVAVPIVAIIVADHQMGDRPGDNLLARVAVDLRDDCRETEPPEGSAAQAALNCSRPDGQHVVVSLFASVPEMDEAYGRLVRDAGVPRGTGDCTDTTGAEHRYPPVGALFGRVLCYRQASGTFVAWTHDETRTLSQASRRDGNDAELYRFWADAVDIPDYPTAKESDLLDLVPERNCERAPAGSLDAFPGVVAAIECDPHGDGADVVSYYRFEDLDSLRRTYESHVKTAGSPHGYCLDAVQPAESGEHVHDLRSVVLGRILCHPGRSGGAVIEWTVEPLQLMGVAAGTDRAELVGWWREDRGPFNPAITEAVNKQAQPPFPTPEERALLDHVPPASRVDCMRPSDDQIARNLPVPPVAAISCGPTRGAGVVFYYQLPDDASMAESYRYNVSPGPDCTSLPENFTGDAPYLRNGVVTGRLGCSTNPVGPYLAWTHDELRILVLAFYGVDQQTLLSWWRDEAGPV